MSIYKQIGVALILPALLWKLIDDDDFYLILDIMEVIEFYASPSYTLANRWRRTLYHDAKLMIAFSF